MSRTVHHVPARHRTHPPYWAAGLSGPCTAHTLPELRYSHAESARAEREGRRPVPTFVAHIYPRALNADLWSPYESTARAALHTFRQTAHKHFRAAPPGTLLTAAEDLDHPPTRHRHRDLWEA